MCAKKCNFFWCLHRISLKREFVHYENLNTNKCEWMSQMCVCVGEGGSSIFNSMAFGANVSSMLDMFCNAWQTYYMKFDVLHSSCYQNASSHDEHWTLNVIQEKACQMLNVFWSVNIRTNALIQHIFWCCSFFSTLMP